MKPKKIISTGSSQMLDSTVAMVASTWKASVCLFFQIDDKNSLSVKAMAGVSGMKWRSFTLDPQRGFMAACVGKDKIVEIKVGPETGELAALIKPFAKQKNKKFILVPVAGQSRVLGALVIGPVPKELDVRANEGKLRSSGALCAVLSAHGRLYEWMSDFLPEVNHELRTPLTAVQGSIGMVLGGMFGEVDPEVRAMLEMAFKGCARTIQAIEGYLSQQQPPKP